MCYAVQIFIFVLVNLMQEIPSAIIANSDEKTGSFFIHIHPAPLEIDKVNRKIVKLIFLILYI